MPNPADKFTEVDGVIEETTKQGNVDIHLKYLENLQNFIPVKAKVKEVLGNGKYLVDLYHDTYEHDPSELDVTVVSTRTEDNFSVGSTFEVSLQENNIGIILPARVARGTGQYKVYILIDEYDPGTPVWAFPRFHKNIP